MYQQYGITPPPAPKAAGIRWGNYLFSEPRVFGTGLVAPVPGVYAIMVTDATWTPRNFRPLYFGETEDFRKRVGFAHEKYGNWKLHAGSLTLYVSHYHTLGTSTERRKAIEEELIGKYNPPCNIMLLGPLTAMLRGLQSR
jgi:hypothetical protein